MIAIRSVKRKERVEKAEKEVGVKRRQVRKEVVDSTSSHLYFLNRY